MTRILVLLLSSAAAFPAFAEDFQVLAPVTEAVVYPQGATLTRTISAELPAGRHRILLPANEDMFDTGLPRLSGASAAKIGAVEILPSYFTKVESVYNDAQSAALQRFEALEEDVQKAEDAFSEALAQSVAADARITFLETVSAGSVEELNPETLKTTADIVQTEIAAALTAKHRTEVAARTLQEALEDLREELTQAQADFERLAPPEGPVDMLAFSIDLDAPGTVGLDLKYLTGAAAWSVYYEMFLTTGSDALVTASRKVIVRQYTDELWTDVKLTLSTADPFAQIDPREVYPNQAQLQDPAVYKSIVRGASASREAELSELADPIVEEPVIVEELAVVAGLEVDGLSITYAYPDAVSVAPGDVPLVLSLDKVEFDADVFNRAAPRYDETAFLMASFTNTQPDALLPGVANLYRDGVFVGNSQIGQIPASTEAEISFGALEGLRTKFTLLKNDTGDRGLLTSSSTRKQSMEFTVENLTNTRETVEAIYALPFTEQEDLNLRVSARPAPDETEFEKRRGVSVWKLDLKPGEKKTVRVDVDLSWPEGETMIWNP